MIKYYNGEYKEIAATFRDAVHITAKLFYTNVQVNAWCPYDLDLEKWKWRCELKRPFVYWEADKIAGFIEYDETGHIDCHYVRPELNRKGIGTKLLHHVLDIADNLNKDKTFVEASHVAKGLYLKNGFVVIKENSIIRHGVVINNWIMERKCAQQGDAPEPATDAFHALQKSIPPAR